MSLPTYARWYNAQGELIAHQFVNVGLWLTEENFIRTVMNLPYIKDAEYLELYGIIVEKKFLNHNDRPTWEECREMLIAAAPSKIKSFGEDSELRAAIQEVYRKSEGK
jgi:hypothetical protein